MRVGDGTVSRAREVVMFWRCSQLRAAAAAAAKPAPLPQVSAAEEEEAASGSQGTAEEAGGGATGSSDEQGWQHHQQKQQPPLRSSSLPLSPPTPTHSPDWRAPPVSRAVLQSHVIDLASPDPAHQLRALTELLRLTRTHARPSSSTSSSSLAPSPATDVLCVIADTGAVPLLVALLSSAAAAAETQELAVTVLHNLSLRSRNKERIIRAPGLLDAALALVRGGATETATPAGTPTPTARHNAAALLFSLLAVPRFRDPVGAHPAGVASLAALFLDATAARTGRRDAVKALFHLALCPGNRARVAAAPGLVRGLLDLLLEPSSSSSSSEPAAAAAAAAAAAEQHHRDGLREDAMALLGVVAASPEGRAAVLACPGGVAGLVRELRAGSPRSKEHAANALLVLCRQQDDEEEGGGGGAGGGDALAAVLEHQEGVVESLCQLQSAGTERGRRKANELLKVLVSVDSTTTAEGDSHQFQ